MKILSIVFAFCLIKLSLSQELLNDIQIQFGLNGSILYTPSSGGVPIPGYIFDIGFSRYSWLGVMFMTLTSKSNYDVLILQRGANQTGGFYPVTISDYFVSSGRQSQLIADSVTNMDKTVTNYTISNDFFIEIDRTKGNTSGEDWEGGDFVSICFFTSNVAFDVNSWSMQYKSCYGYDISALYFSTFQGVGIGSMIVEGSNSTIYGGITGPYLAMQLYWYIPTTTSFNNFTDLFIRLGNQINSNVGYDFFDCNNGDFYGLTTTSLYKDILYSGYDNGECTLTISSNSIKLSFRRDVYTYDQFDSQINENINICVIGTQTNCQTMRFTTLYPMMSVSSALTLYEHLLYPILVALILTNVLIM